MSQSTLPLRRRRWLRVSVITAIVLVPLAVAGFVVGAVSNVNDGIDRIPAAIVNNDERITQTAADGTETTIVAGRLLVTQLTGPDSAGFDWTITNSEDAEKMLADGDVYAIVEIPKDFSKSIVSLSTDDPVRANLNIRTDDAHNYLTGSAAQLVGDSMAATFGQAITSQYIAGIYSSIGSLGSALSDAADGADTLSDGMGTLADGLGTLTDGAGTAADGASDLADGVTKYTDGVSTVDDGFDQYLGGVEKLGKGLRTFQSTVQGTTADAIGVSGYTTGVSTLSGLLDDAVGDLDPNDDGVAQVEAIAEQIAGAAAGGSQVVNGVNQTFAGIAAGIGESAAGAETLVDKGGDLGDGLHTLATSGDDLADGTHSLADGLYDLEDGADKSADGASKLADGTSTLADGLRSGADQVPTIDADKAADTADIASSPVEVSVTRDNKVSDFGQIISTLFLPVGLWVGAFAIFMVMRPVSRTVLSSTATGGRIALSAVTRGGTIAAAQATLLALLMHTTLDVGWALFPATLLFSLIMALAFTAFHYLLTVAFGRFGLVVSVFLLALQITATGGLYPIQLLAPFFQAISPILPLTYAVGGIQAIVAGSGVSAIIAPTLYLVAFGLLSMLFAVLSLGRVRRVRALAIAPVRA